MLSKNAYLAHILAQLSLTKEVVAVYGKGLKKSFTILKGYTSSKVLYAEYYIADHLDALG
jgi:predicted HTH transcriptional regulator